jgi:hypothetical protein
MKADGSQTRARKVVSYTISPESDARLRRLARRLHCSSSVLVELLVWDAKVDRPGLREAAAKMTADNKDRRYAGRRGWETRRLGQR